MRRELIEKVLNVVEGGDNSLPEYLAASADAENVVKPIGDFARRLRFVVYRGDEVVQRCGFRVEFLEFLRVHSRRFFRKLFEFLHQFRELRHEPLVARVDFDKLARVVYFDLDFLRLSYSYFCRCHNVLLLFLVLCAYALGVSAVNSSVFALNVPAVASPMKLKVYPIERGSLPAPP